MTAASIDSIPVAKEDDFFGHATILRKDRLGFLRRLGSLGPLGRVRFLNRYLVFANQPEAAHQVLVTEASSFEKSPGIRLLLRDLAGEGLFTSEGEHWKRQRRLMSPLFHPSQLATYTQSMNDEARRAVERWQEGDRVDLLRDCTRIAMGVVGTTLFGAAFNEVDEIGDALTTLLGWVNDLSASQFLTTQILLLETVERLGGHLPGPLEKLRSKVEAILQEPVLLPGRHRPEILRAKHTLERHMEEKIRERRARNLPRKDLLTRLLLARDGEPGRSGQTMTDEQVRDEANTLFVAGHETTATALAWSFYLLARHPEARARVQAEADAFGPDGPVQAEPQKLAYTTRVFKEVLRMYPPLLLLARRAVEPVEIGGVLLPKRTIMFISPYTVHFQPNIWPNPDAFDPDRFLPEREAGRHKAAWLPFGEGPRVCIGNHFALLEGPIVLATLMRRARFEIDPHRVTEPEFFATLRPRGGVPATVHLRKD
jgi:cytochrome P450